MGIQDDFKQFTIDVNVSTNAIAAALGTIVEELAAKVDANPHTPADIVQAVADAKAALQVVSDNATAIAAANKPVVPDPVVLP